MSSGTQFSNVLRLDMLAQELDMVTKQTYLASPSLVDDLAFILSTDKAVVEAVPNVVLVDLQQLISNFKNDLDNLVKTRTVLGGTPPPNCGAGFHASNGRCVPDP